MSSRLCSARFVTATVAGIVLVAACTNPHSSARTPTSNTSSTAAAATVAISSPRSTVSNVATDTVQPPTCGSDPITAATNFAVAVQQGDIALEKACESSHEPLPADVMARLRDVGPRRINDATDVSRTGDVDRTIDIPGPTIPNIDTGGGTTIVLAPHICGVLVTINTDLDKTYARHRPLDLLQRIAAPNMTR